MFLVEQFVVFLQVAEIFPHTAGRFVAVILDYGEVIHVRSGGNEIITRIVYLVQIHGASKCFLSRG